MNATCGKVPSDTSDLDFERDSDKLRDPEILQYTPLKIEKIPRYGGLHKAKISDDGNFIVILDQNWLIAKINSYQAYEDNWDGYGGVAPSEEIVKACIRFVHNLPDNLVLPRPGLSGDGEIGLFWEQGNIYIDVGFTNANSYSYYARNEKGEECFGDDKNICEPIPEDLANVVSQVD